MQQIGARQIKAARALLDWSQDDLANASKLSIATIRKLELGYISPRHKTAIALFQTFEGANVEFLDGDGVRRSKESLRSFEGVTACSSFFDDLLHTVQKEDGEVLLVLTSALNTHFAEYTNVKERLGRLTKQKDGVLARILVTDGSAAPSLSTNFEYRSLPSNYVDPMPFCIYGDKHALIDVRDGTVSKIIVVQSKSISILSRRQFYSMWDKSLCFPTQRAR